VPIEINELEEPSDWVRAKINAKNPGISFDEVLEVCGNYEKAALSNDPERGTRLLVRGWYGGRVMRIVLYPIDQDRGTWRLATAFYV